MNITYSELLNICQSHLVAMADELINKGREDAIDEIVKLMKPCNNCPSYPNECNDIDYFEDCCRTEQSISWEDLRKLAEMVKEQTNES